MTAGFSLAFGRTPICPVWLAKSLILLSDINVERNEIFQAKQYLLALQSNYKLQDDIPAIIETKLQAIAQLEQQTEQPTTETEEETLWYDYIQ